MEAVVADARRLLEGADEGLLQRVVEIERLGVAGEAERALRRSEVKPRCRNVATSGA